MKLTTLMIVSPKYQKSLPLMHMISKREREEFELGKFFECMREWLEKPKLFMSDCAANYSALISKYFEGVKHLWCIWHVYRAWGSKAKKLLGKDAPWAFAKLIEIQKNMNKEAMIRELNIFLKKCPSEFQKYFQAYYLPSIFKWAAFNRCKTGVNVNMALESFHRILKRDFLKSNKNFNESLSESDIKL